MVGLLVELPEQALELALLLSDVLGIHLVVLDILGDLLDFVQEDAVMPRGLSPTGVVAGQFSLRPRNVGQGYVVGAGFLEGLALGEAHVIKINATGFLLTIEY